MADNDNDIIIEFTSVGRSLKVTAICTKTGDEVAMVGDPAVPRSQLRMLAARKLRFVQNKKRQS